MKLILFSIMLVMLYSCDNKNESLGVVDSPTIKELYYYIPSCENGSKAGFRYGITELKRINYKAVEYVKEGYQVCDGVVTPAIAGSIVSDGERFSSLRKMQQYVEKDGNTDIDKMLTSTIYSQIIKIYYNQYEERSRIFPIFSKSMVQSFLSMSAIEELPMLKVRKLDKSTEEYKKVATIIRFIDIGPASNNFGTETIAELNELYYSFYKRYIDLSTIQRDLSTISKLYTSGVRPDDLEISSSLFDLVVFLKMRAYLDRVLFTDFSAGNETKRRLKFNYLKSAGIIKNKLIVDLDIINELTLNFDSDMWFWNENFAAGFGNIPLIDIPITKIAKYRNFNLDKEAQVYIPREFELETALVSGYLKYNKEYLVSINLAAELVIKTNDMLSKIGFTNNMFESRKKYIGEYYWPEITRIVEDHISTLIRSGAISTSKELREELSVVAKKFKVGYYKLMSPEAIDKISLSLE